jgi:hypothetical protein
MEIRLGLEWEAWLFGDGGRRPPSKRICCVPHLAHRQVSSVILGVQSKVRDCYPHSTDQERFLLFLLTGVLLLLCPQLLRAPEVPELGAPVLPASLALRVPCKFWDCHNAMRALRELF